jgi:hypothetical protein
VAQKRLLESYLLRKQVEARILVKELRGDTPQYMDLNDLADLGVEIETVEGGFGYTDR